MKPIPKLHQKGGGVINSQVSEDDLEIDKTGNWVIKKKTPVQHEVPDDLKERIHKKVWKTKDGREIPISDMETIHILRTRKLLQTKSHQNHPATKEYLRLFQIVLHQRDPNVFDPPK